MNTIGYSVKSKFKQVPPLWNFEKIKSKKINTNFFDHKDILPKVQTNATPAYFHPSFILGNKTAKLSSFIDHVIANPQDEKYIKKKFTVKIREALASIIKDEKNLIGQGHIDKVYRIDDKYAVKISSVRFKKIDEFSFRIPNGNADNYNSVKINNDKKFDDLQTWYGKPLVEIGSAKIIKNAGDLSTSVPYGAPVKKSLMGMSEEKLIEYYGDVRALYKETMLPQLAAMPQKAFDALAKDFKILNAVKDEPYSYSFMSQDPGNFLLLENEIKIVGKIAKTYIPITNNLTSMLEPFLCKYHSGGHAQYKPVFDDELINVRKEILKKCIIACEKEELPLELDSKKHDMRIVCNSKNRDMRILNNALNLSGYTTTAEKLFENLKGFRKNFPSMERRLDIISRHLEQID